MTKYLIISDIHANRPAFDSILSHADGFDGIWFLGDLFDRGPEPAWVYTTLRQQENEQMVWLAGNHDLAIAYLLDSQRYADYKVLYDRLDGVFKKSIQDQMDLMPKAFIHEIARRAKNAYRSIGGIGTFMVHGFPFDEPNASLLHYYLDTPPLNGNKVNYLNLHHQVTRRARIWLVGHAHRQAAWFCRGTEAGWEELLPGFGVGLNGEKRKFTPDSTQAQILATAEVDFSQQADDAFLLLSPGSVAYGHDSNSADGNAWAKYLTLEFNASCIKAEFHAVPYRS